MRNLVLSLAAAALTTSCGLFAPGSVTVPSGVDDFGAARSAVWAVITTTYDGDVDVDHSLVMSSDGGYCRKAQNTYQEIADSYEMFYEDYYSLYYDLKAQYGKDYKAFYQAFAQQSCQITKDFIASYADSTSRLVNDTNLVALETRTFVKGEGVDDEPMEGSYSSTMEYTQDNVFRGSVVFYDENPFAAASEALEDTDCSEIDKKVKLYKSIKGEVQEPIDIEGGQLTLEARGDDTFRAELTGASLGEADGFELEGNFKRCDIAVDGYAYFYLL